MRSKKIKLYPTKEQKETLKLWFGSRRWVYNQCLNHIKQNKTFFQKGKGKSNQKILRDLFVSGEDKKAFSKNTPYDIRDEGMRDLLKNYNSNFALLRKGVIKHFSVGFKKGKNASDTIGVPHKHYSRMSGEFKILQEMKKSEKDD